ncbi:MAG: CehA/McbA family metallohydrolase [Planctomycetia bacterium]|nr:CehA/McbA family metallohydrolase [Planctomycetia bacterium]
MRCLLSNALVLLAIAAASSVVLADTRLEGRIVDDHTGQPLPARLYIQGQDGAWHFAKSADPAGSAVEYKKTRGNDGKSVEMHTTLSAHPFVADLPPGTYTITIERGKEYLPLVKKLTVAERPLAESFKLRKFINLAEVGWYSGDTHVHRSLEELPNAQLADDLNVTFPLVYWVTEAYKSPLSSQKSAAGGAPDKLIELDATHVIWSRNTEYELFSVDGKPHTLGAVFLLNHRTPIDLGAPPVSEIARRARAEGAILELDKHNWPWSMAIAPVMKVDLFELANNHHWRTEFAFRTFGEAPPDWMHVDRDAAGMTELGWTQFGFENYYALLNCGLKMSPTGGTASGVHPVPLGWGRVYVHLDPGKPFSYEDWLAGLKAGRSFVTTGPLLLAQVDGQEAGHVFQLKAGATTKFRVHGRVISAQPLATIEIVEAGRVVRRLEAANHERAGGGYESVFDENVPVAGSTWLAVRCFEKTPEGRTRFAHSAPFFVESPGRPLRPRPEQAEYLLRRVQEQIERSQKILPAAAIDEYRQAAEFYRRAAGPAP